MLQPAFWVQSLSGGYGKILKLEIAVNYRVVLRSTGVEKRDEDRFGATLSSGLPFSELISAVCAAVISFPTGMGLRLPLVGRR
jgi:hypothetical protein